MAKFLKTAHTDNSQIGMGDYYGSGIRQKQGKIDRSYIQDIASKKELAKRPTRLA